MQYFTKISATGLILVSLLVVAQEETQNTKEIIGLTISKNNEKKYKNPAHEILEKLIAKKNLNNPENLSSYSSENHMRTEIAMNNLGNKLKKQKLYQDLKKIMDSAIQNGEQPILPFFISESTSDYYYQKYPQKTAEIIKKSKIEGVGVEDQTMFSQLISSTFIKYNFYNNHIRILEKEFTSPISDNFTLQYNYELINRDLIINEKSYYQIDFKPKRASDLAFEGTLFIDHETYSLYKIEAKILPSANLNFINNILIRQEFAKLESTDVHMPIKSEIIVETANLGKKGMSGILKYSLSSKNIKIEQKLDEKIFDQPIKILPNAYSEENWDNYRHRPLSHLEKNKYATLKKINNLSSIKPYVRMFDSMMSGYINVGKIDIRGILYSVGYNDTEGIRLSLGGKTSTKFSNKWIIGGNVGYGFKDKKFKVKGFVDYIISREPWMQTGISASHDLDQVALQYGNFSITEPGLFNIFIRNGNVSRRKAFWKNDYQAYFQTDFLQNFTQKIIFNHFTFNPLFDFSYDNNGKIIHQFKTSELILRTTWNPAKKNIQSNKNTQITLKNDYFSPTITFQYTRGLKGVFGSDFNYNKFHLNIQQSLPMGILGKGNYSLTAGISTDKIPYPLLENHLGNNSVFYTKAAFNTMKFFEFTSSRFISLQYTQDLEGLITNSLPIIKKWDWRNNLVFNYLIGDNQYQNISNIGSLNGKPYIELGYGISNIFRFLRVDFIHRLNHLDNNNPYIKQKLNKFTIKLSAQIRL